MVIATELSVETGARVLSPARAGDFGEAVCLLERVAR